MRSLGDFLKDFARRYGLMTIAAVAIAYGSLYPFVFRDSGPFGADLLHLAGTWMQPPQSRGDTLANLLLYMPLGLTSALAFGREGRPAWLSAIACGAVLSLSMELAQFYDESRVSCLSDFYLNVLGTLGGCVVAWAGGASLFSAWWRPGSAPAFARLLLLAWLGWRLYPYVPTIDLHKYWKSVKPLLFESHAAPQDIFRYAIFWLSAIFLVQTGLRPQRLVWFLPTAMLGFFAAKILIVGQVISLPDILGAGIALILARPVFQKFRSAGIFAVAALLLLEVVLIRILPWQFSTTLKTFQWVPFFSFLHGSLQVDAISFSQKFYLYGAVILLLTQSGMRLGMAVALECAILLITSVLQMFMVGRSAEVSDALLALALGIIYMLLRRQYPEAPQDAALDVVR
jgi:VanZ family protein